MCFFPILATSHSPQSSLWPRATRTWQHEGLNSFLIWWFRWLKISFFAKPRWFGNSSQNLGMWLFIPNKHIQMPTSSATNGFFETWGSHEQYNCRETDRCRPHIKKLFVQAQKNTSQKAVPNLFVCKNTKKHRIKMFKNHLRNFITTIGKQNRTKRTCKYTLYIYGGASKSLTQKLILEMLNITNFGALQRYSMSHESQRLAKGQNAHHQAGYLQDDRQSRQFTLAILVGG